MVTRYDDLGVVWVDLLNPSKEETEGIKEEFNLHTIVANELLERSERTKVDLYSHYAYLIFSFPSLSLQAHDHLATELEVDFVVGKNFIITSHYQTVDPLYMMGRLIETRSLLKREEKVEHAGFIFYALMRRLYQAVEDDLFHLNRHLKTIESGIFDGREKKMVEDISKINRVLIDYWWSTRAHSDLLSSFEIIAKNYWGGGYDYYVRSLSGEYAKISKRIDGCREVLSGLRDTNDSLLASKSNESMKALTAIATIFIPIQIVSNIFNMNTVNNPIVGARYDFWILLILMISLCVLTLAYSRKKKWI